LGLGLRRVGLKNRLTTIGIVCLLVTAGLFGFITFESEVMSAKTIYVGGIGPLNYSKIQDAINVANPGDTVYVYSGIYYENVVVDESINLTGENREITIIDGGGSGNTVYVTSKCVNITGFTVTGSGSATNAGIYLDHIQNCYVFNNKISNNLHNGIYLRSSSNNDITKNNISSNGWDGINLYNSSDNKITNNNIPSNSQDGIYFYLSANNIFTNNTVPSNDNEGIDLDSSNNNIVTNNNVSYNSDGIQISSSVGNIINGNYVSSSVGWGIFLGYSYNNSIMNNVVTYSNRLQPPFAAASVYLFAATANKIINNTISWNNVDGIFLDADFVPSSDDNIIADNTVLSNNGHGIHLHYPSKNNTITNNFVSNNLGYGIYLDNSPTSKLMNNIVTNNIEGIYLASSYNGTVTGNTVFSNQNRGIFIFGCVNDNYASNNVFLNGGDGLSLRSSININVTNNIISNNANGIYLWLSSNDNIITKNNISNNLEGINVSSSSNNNIIVKNIVFNNFYGICLEGSSNNSIYHNNIIDNTNQAIDDTNNSNQWDNGYPSGGNYWSDFDEPSEGAFDGYKGPDQNVLGSDGIVDNGTIAGGGKNPYVIDGDSQDNYPLIKFVKYLFLYEGWNLISIPFIQPDTNLGTVLNSINGSYDAVQWYNVSDNSDPWKHNSTKKPSYLNDLNDIHHKMGFWIHIIKPGGVLFQYSGVQPIENQTITLHPGWNLVGYPSLISYNRTQGLNNITFGTDVDSIWTYNAATKKWEELGPSDYIEIGRGYWIHSKVEKDWDVPL
jgi:parallel beta-helix repeat protein